MIDRGNTEIREPRGKNASSNRARKTLRQQTQYVVARCARVANQPRRSCSFGVPWYLWCQVVCPSPTRSSGILQPFLSVHDGAFILFFFPPGTGGGEGGIPAKDALGNDIFAKPYLESKPVGDRSLAQGLKGDAT